MGSKPPEWLCSAMRLRGERKPRSRINRPIQRPPLSMARPAQEPVTPEVAGSSPVAPAARTPAACAYCGLSPPWPSSWIVGSMYGPSPRSRTVTCEAWACRATLLRAPEQANKMAAWWDSGRASSFPAASRVVGKGERSPIPVSGGRRASVAEQPTAVEQRWNRGQERASRIRTSYLSSSSSRATSVIAST